MTEQKFKSGIYLIRCKTTKKVYVGSSIYITKRFYAHKKELRSDKHCNKYLQNAWDKYGENDFEFIWHEKYNDKKTLRDREQYWMDKLKATDRRRGFNLAPTAKYVPDYHHKQKRSEEHRRKLSEAAKKRTHSKEHISKLSAAGQKKIKELREKGDPRIIKAKSVYCLNIETNEFTKYDSVKQAAELNNYYEEKIRCCIRGYRNKGTGGNTTVYSYKGCIWKYTKKECMEQLNNNYNRKPKKKVLSKKHKENISKSMKGRSKVLQSLK